MTRILKSLALALVAVFALSAVAASTASAQLGTLTADGPVTLTGTETGVSQNWFEAFAAKIECPGSTFTGHKVATTPHTPISSGATAATLTPIWKESSGGAPNCKVPSLSLTATIDMNGCDYVVQLGGATEAEDQYAVEFSIVCPEGKQIEVTWWTGSHANATFCSIDVPAQSGLKGATATDTTNGTVDIQGTITGITATKTKHGAGVLCPHEQTSTAKLAIDMTVKGDNPAGGATDISLVEVPEQDVALTADGPVTLTGTETGVSQNWFEAFAAKIECPGSTFTGHKVATTPHTPISSGATAATLTPIWKESSGGAPNCKVPSLSLTATIDMNGCDYVVQLGGATEAEDQYAVEFSIVCPEGKQIEVTWWTGSHANATFCSIDVPAQSGLKGATATDTTNGTVDIQGTITGITATKTKHGAGVLCPHEQTSTAKLAIDMTVKGDNPAGGATDISLVEVPEQDVALTADGPVTLTGTETGVSQNWFEAFAAKIECPGSTFTGHKVATTPHTPISSGATAATLTPIWKESSGGAPNCKVPSLSLTATIDMNGCDYVVQLGGATEAEDQYAVEFSIVCPEGKQIEVTWWTGSHANATFCSIDVPAQSGLKGATATDTTNGTVDIQGTITGITATKTKHGAGVLCPHEQTSTAKLAIDMTVKGDNPAGGATPITMSQG